MRDPFRLGNVAKSTPPKAATLVLLVCVIALNITRPRPRRPTWLGVGSTGERKTKSAFICDARRNPSQPCAEVVRTRFFDLHQSRKPPGIERLIDSGMCTPSQPSATAVRQSCEINTLVRHDLRARSARVASSARVRGSGWRTMMPTPGGKAAIMDETSMSRAASLRTHSQGSGDWRFLRRALAVNAATAVERRCNIWAS